jgi:hypothetical protein
MGERSHGALSRRAASGAANAADTNTKGEVMIRVKTRLAALAAIAGVVASVLVLPQVPASAHSLSVSHGSDTAAVSSNHQPSAVCDGEDDGHWVQGQYVSASGQSHAVSNRFGRGTCVRSLSTIVVERFRVCEFYSSGRLVGCSASRTVT